MILNFLRLQMKDLYITIGGRGDCLCLYLGKFIVAFTPSDAAREEFFVNYKQRWKSREAG